MTAHQKPFDVTKLQDEIARQLEQLPPIEYAPPHIRYRATDAEQQPVIDYLGGGEETPAYLPMTDNVSAVMVASQYDAAAKELELMGDALKEAARRAEAMAAKVLEALKYITDTAAAYREEATIIFNRIEKVDELSTAVIAACEDLKQRATTLDKTKN